MQKLTNKFVSFLEKVYGRPGWPYLFVRCQSCYSLVPACDVAEKGGCSECGGRVVKPAFPKTRTLIWWAIKGLLTRKGWK